MILLLKLSSATYAVRIVCYDLKTRKLIYFAYFHCHMEFYSGATQQAKPRFLQLRSMLSKQYVRSFHKPHLEVSSKNLVFLLVPIDLLIVICNYKQAPVLTSDIHGFNARNKHNQYKSHNSLSVAQNSVHYCGIAVFNNLPHRIS